MKRYYDRTRKEIEGLLPGPVHRVVELGCGEGPTLAYLKEQKYCDWVAGIELSEEAARQAASVLDEVHIGNVEQMDPLPIAGDSIDLLLCLDVLEHLIDPWTTLRRLRSLLRSRGMVIVSIPNIRHYKVLADLIFKGRFDYDPDGGILDSTHLRFFTRRSAIQLLEQAGFHIRKVEVTGIKKGKAKWWINKLFAGALTDFYARQFLILASRRSGD